MIRIFLILQLLMPSNLLVSGRLNYNDLPHGDSDFTKHEEPNTLTKSGNSETGGIPVIIIKSTPEGLKQSTSTYLASESQIYDRLSKTRKVKSQMTISELQNSIKELEIQSGKLLIYTFTLD